MMISGGRREALFESPIIITGPPEGFAQWYCNWVRYLIFTRFKFFFPLNRASVHRFAILTFDEILQTAIVGNIVDKMTGENCEKLFTY